MIELISERRESSKKWEVSKFKYQLLKQAGQHYNDLLLGRYEPCNADLVAGSFVGDFTHDVNKIQLPFRVDSFTGKRRFYPVVGNKTKWIEEGGFAGLTNSNVSGKELSFSNTNYDTQFITKPEGCKLQIILKNKDAPTSFSFPLTLNKLVWDNWKITDGGIVVATLDKGYAVDSSEEQIFRPLAAEYSNGVVSFSLDTKDMVYPVYIDPNVTKQPPDADSYLSSKNPNNKYGASTKNWINAAVGDLARTIMKFDFSGDGVSGTIDAGATQSIYISDNVGAAARTYEANRLDTYQSSWVENNCDWVDYDDPNSWDTVGGDYTAVNQDTATVPAAGNWMDFTNVTAQVQWALDDVGADPSVMHSLIKDDTENDSGRTAHYSKDEAVQTASRPKLVFTFTVAGGAEDMALHNIGMGANSGIMVGVG